MVCDRKSQKGCQLVGGTIAACHTARSCICNASKALLERHLAAQPTPTRRLRCPRKLVDAIVASYSRQTLDYDEWLSSWPAGKRRAIERSVLHDVIDVCDSASFVKRSGEHKEVAVPRLIQKYGNLGTQAEFAVEHKRAQKAIFEVLGGDKGDGFECAPGVFVAGTSGWTSKDISAWARRNSNASWYYERDAERWDASQQRIHHNCKMSLFRKLGKEFAQSVEKSFAVRGRTRGAGRHPTTISYASRGTVKSGYNDTTSGNTLVNACISAAAIAACGLRANILVMGDDMLAAVWGAEIPERVAEYEKSFGIRPKYQVHHDVASASFCSGHFLDDGNRIMFVPNFGRNLCRLFWTVNPVSPKHLPLHQHNVASCMLTTYPNHPWYRAWLGDMRIAGAAAKFDKHKHRGPAADEGFDYDSALCRRYDIDSRDRDGITEVLKRVPRVGWFWSERLRPIVERDLTGVTTGIGARDEILRQAERAQERAKYGKYW